MDVERMVGLVVDAAAERARIWLDAEEAADVAQDVGFKFWEAWRTDPGLFDAETVPMQWICVAVRHTAVDRHRAAEARASLDAPAEPRRDEAVASADDPVRHMESQERLRHLAEALNSLSARQREIWLRVRDRGESYDEVALALGIGRETVKTQMARAIHVLRNALVLYEGGPVND